MLKITAIGNLTNDVELKMSEATGKPYAILRIASDRRYKDRDGNKLTDFISIKVRGPLAERCAEFAWKGCKLAAAGDFETIPIKLSKPKTIKAQPKHIEIRAYNCSAYLILFIVFSPLQLQHCCSNAFFKSRTN